MVHEEPPIEETELPIEATWEFAEVRVEKVESPHYPNIPSQAHQTAASDEPTSSQPEVSL